MELRTLVVESFRAWGQIALKTLSKLAFRLSVQANSTKQDVTKMVVACNYITAPLASQCMIGLKGLHLSQSVITRKSSVFKGVLSFE